MLNQLLLAPAGHAVQFLLVAALMAVLLPFSAAFARRRLRETSPRDLAVAAACMLLGLIIRGSLEPFPSDIRSALDMGFSIGVSHRWAAGYSFLQHLLFSVLPSELETVSRANVLLDTLSVGLIYAIARAHLREPAAAAAAAAVYAAHPVAARFAASDSAHVPVTLCYLAALWLLGVWRKEGGLRPLFAAAGWWALACNARMEAVIFAPVAALFVLALPPGAARSWKPAAGAALAAAPFLVFPVADIVRDLLVSGGAFNLKALLDNPFVDVRVSPAPFIAAAVLGLAVGWRRSPWRLGVLLAAAALVALPSMPPTDDNQTNFRYFLPLLALCAFPAGQGAAAALAYARRGTAPPGLTALLSLVLLIGAASVPWRGFLVKVWTHQSEFAFARRHLRGVADGCAVVRLARFRAEAGLDLSPMLSREVGRDHRWIDTEKFLLSPAPEGCVVYYQSASCHALARTAEIRETPGAFHTRPECLAMRRRFRLEPLAEARLAAAPYGAEAYTEDPVPVGFYRVAGENREL